MSRPAPLPSATALLPQVGLQAAALFGVQDRAMAVGLLGEARVAQIVATIAPPPRATPDPSTRAGRAAGAVLALQPWIAVPILVAVSGSGIHLIDWDPAGGAQREVARFDGDLHVTVESYRSARRLSLTDGRGYRLALTASVGPWDPGRHDVREVLAALPRPAQSPPGTPTP